MVASTPCPVCLAGTSGCLVWILRKTGSNPVGLPLVKRRPLWNVPALNRQPPYWQKMTNGRDVVVPGLRRVLVFGLCSHWKVRRVLFRQRAEISRLVLCPCFWKVKVAGGCQKMNVPTEAGQPHDSCGLEVWRSPRPCPQALTAGTVSVDGHACWLQSHCPSLLLVGTSDSAWKTKEE